MVLDSFQAILNYRELQRSNWNRENQLIISRIVDTAFEPQDKVLSNVHILDLAEDGVIKPHIDSVRFCGRTIAGLSLLTDSVMRLTHHQEPAIVADLLLKRRSLYIMKDAARFDFKHEILANSISRFKDNPVHKTRRVSLICRCEP